MTNKIALLYTTIGTAAEAEQLAGIIIPKKLAACVNIISGGKSIYIWNDRIEQAAECYMLFKTTTEKIFALEQAIIANHPYDTPAILKFNLESSEEFFNYISKSIEYHK